MIVGKKAESTNADIGDLQRLGGASVAEISDYGRNKHALESALIPIEPSQDEVQNGFSCSAISSWSHTLHIRWISP